MILSEVEAWIRSKVGFVKEAAQVQIMGRSRRNDGRCLGS